MPYSKEASEVDRCTRGRQIGINPKRLMRGEIGRKRGVAFHANNNSVKVSMADEAKRDERKAQPSHLYFICIGKGLRCRYLLGLTQ